jgi:hypothetical protein
MMESCLTESIPMIQIQERPEKEKILNKVLVPVYDGMVKRRISETIANLQNISLLSETLTRNMSIIPEIQNICPCLEQ